jgi:hypothetical protein
MRAQPKDQAEPVRAKAESDLIHTEEYVEIRTTGSTLKGMARVCLLYLAALVLSGLVLVVGGVLDGV